MLVEELIKELQKFDPNAEVKVHAVRQSGLETYCSHVEKVEKDHRRRAVLIAKE